MSSAARSVLTPSSPITPAVTGTVPNVRPPPLRNGWPSARQSCCRCRTITWCSPCRLDRRYRLSEQGCHLRPAVQGLIRDHAHHRSRSQASRRSHWHLVRPPHLGLGDDPSPACTHDRAGRWVLTRRKALGLMSATLLPVSGGAVSLVPPVV